MIFNTCSFVVLSGSSSADITPSSFRSLFLSYYCLFRIILRLTPSSIILISYLRLPSSLILLSYLWFLIRILLSSTACHPLWLLILLSYLWFLIRILLSSAACHPLWLLSIFIIICFPISISFCTIIPSSLLFIYFWIISVVARFLLRWKFPLLIILVPIIIFSVLRRVLPMIIIFISSRACVIWFILFRSFVSSSFDSLILPSLVLI